MNYLLHNRRKRGGTDLTNNEGSEGGGAGDGVTKSEKNEKEDNSRIDDLWASFKQDVGMPSRLTKREVPTSGSKVLLKALGGRVSFHC